MYGLYIRFWLTLVARVGGGVLIKRLVHKGRGQRMHSMHITSRKE